MRERATLIGDGKSLVAITTEPPREAAVDDATGIVLVSAGLVHRVGPNRLYVRLARRLAATGCPVLRFDLSGVGDSRARRDGVPIDERAVLETQEAMSYLEGRRGCRRFVLAGLCSGADDAFRTALVDTRVTGLILIDPCLYPSTGHTLRAYARRALRPRSWMDLVTGRSDLWTVVGRLVRRGGGTGRSEAAMDWKQIPGHEFRDGLVSLSGRGVRLLLVYSPGSAAHHNYRVNVLRQRPALPSEAIRVECVPGADHTFTGLDQQAALFDRATAWVGEHFVAPSAPPTTISA